jgi:IPT/TIG domain
MNMKLLKPIWLLCTLILFFNACKDKKKNDPAVELTISDMSPRIGPKDTEVTLTGTEFGTDANNVKVYFNGKLASIVSVNNTSIKVKVPAKAYTGTVKIVVNGMETTFGVAFEYLTSDITVSNVTSLGSTGANLAFDASDSLCVTDLDNNKLYKIGIQNGTTTIRLVAGGLSNFNLVSGIATDDVGNVYVSDLNRILKVNNSGVTKLIAGSFTAGNLNGDSINARFNNPLNMTYKSGNLFIVDQANNSIRKLDLQTKQVTTLSIGSYNAPYGITFDKNGVAYIADQGNFAIKKLTSNGAVGTFAGSTQGFKDGVGNVAKFGSHLSIASDQYGNVFVSDRDNHRIRRISTGGYVTTLAGNGIAGNMNGDFNSALIGSPDGITVDKMGNVYFFNSYPLGAGTIRKIVFD